MGAKWAISGRSFTRDEAGELQSEVLEERGQRPPEEEGGGGDEDFSFSCEGNELELLGSDGAYRLILQEDDEEIPVEAYRLEFFPREGRYLPRSIQANFNTTFVLIPVKRDVYDEFERVDVSRVNEHFSQSADQVRTRGC